jgi:DNA replication protein DnaC
MINRLVHHADVALKGDSYRLSKERDLVSALAANSDEP